MKTIVAKTNPAFKRAQLLPMHHNIQPPTVGSAARRSSALTPPQTGLPARMIDPVVCAGNVDLRLNPPAVQSQN
ncbi:MAG: hypothetical protein EPO07_11430 [Verrucomicrobia bacterium]|nr:MAG: hypothetical protein EPO07_11430 [Verrucomicrobiota bacterium]